MAERRALLVVVDAVVVGQLDLGLARVAAIAHEGQVVLLLGPQRLAQQVHAQHLGVEIDRSLQVADPQHGVEHEHC